MGVQKGRSDWLVWLATGLIGALTLTFSILQTDEVTEALGVFGGIVVAILVLAATGIGLRGS